MGRTVEQLKEDVKVTKRFQPVIPEAARLLSSQQANANGATIASSTKDASARKDKAPVKVRELAYNQPTKYANMSRQPLGEIMDLAKILKAKHTPEQVALLWNAFHASRSAGTGRGYLSAAIPLATYKQMADVARRYPSFVLPLPRDAVVGATDTEVDSGQDERQRAFEFHFMEWAFHAIPPVPSAHSHGPLDISYSPPPTSAHSDKTPSENPATSTILFTPLQEYKLHQSFATPHLVVTHYTDLTSTHGLVLLRGEITPSNTSNSTASSHAGGGNQRYRLSQQDAQLLALGVQRFYLASFGADAGDDLAAERAMLLSAFHENSRAFDWEKLLRHAGPAA